MKGIGKKPMIQEEPLQIENSEPTAALVIHQMGHATGAVIVSEHDNPALKLISKGNAAPLELEGDTEDLIWAPTGDARFRQLIALLHVCIGVGGSLQIADTDDPTEYHDVLKLGPASEIVVGNPERGNNIRIRVPIYGNIDFEVGGALILRISSQGIRIHPGSIKEDL